MVRTNLFKKLMYYTQKTAAYVEEVLWNIEFNRLFNLCSDTGGESSPFFDRLQKHLEKDPRKEK